MDKRNTDFKANKFVIPTKVIKQMDRMIHKTHSDGRERGMSLCSKRNDNKIITGLKSVGTDRGISLPESCRKRNQKYIGSFHTHPDDSETAASAQDLFSSCLPISNLDCIGKNSKGEIVCYEKKNKGSSCTIDAEPLKDIEDVFHELPYGTVQEIKESLYKEVDKVADKKFDKHIVKEG